MQNGQKIEDAAQRLQELIADDIVRQLRGTNEATTRLRLVDEVLALLGWRKEDYNPELPTTAGDYTDYRLSIDGVHRLIVEAKKMGRVNPPGNPLRKSEYENGYLHKNCGKEMTELLDQCLKYSMSSGIRYAVATTGDVWIVLVNFLDGFDWHKLRAVVFHSLDEVYQRFDEFYKLISREAVAQNSLRDKFGHLIPVPPSAIRPRDQVSDVPDVRQVAEQQIITAFFEHFMGDIAQSDQVSLLKECYVSDRKIHEYSRELQHLLEYNPVLDEIEKTAPEVDSKVIKKEVEFQLSSGRPKVVLLVGNVGAGKSTFVRRFMWEQLQPPDETERKQHKDKESVCVVIDLLNKSSIDIQATREEEQELAGEVLRELAIRFKDKLNPYDPNVLRQAFAQEVKHFRMQMGRLYERDIDAYEIKLSEYLFEIQKDRRKHLFDYIRYARRKFYTWIVFDNIDRGYATYQRFIYDFAHLLTAEAGCVAMITLREDTFLDMQSRNLFDARYPDKIYRIYAPEIVKVIARRRRYVDSLIEEGRLPRPFKPYVRLVTLLNRHIKKLITGGNKAVRELLSAFCMSNLRDELSKLQNYYTSYHSTFHEFYKEYRLKDVDDESTKLDYKKEYTRFLQSLMLSNTWSYKESIVFNIFSVTDSERASHFLKLRILAYFIIKRPPSTRASTPVLYRDLIEDFVFLGYPRNHVKEAVKNLLQSGLLVSPNLPVNSTREVVVDLPDLIAPNVKISLSSRGLSYLRNLTAHPYYQTRVGEDTVWYDEQLVNLYIQNLEKSAENQGADADDILLATNARDIFMQYLQASLAHEIANKDNIYSATDWSQKVNTTIEHLILQDRIGTHTDGIPPTDVVSISIVDKKEQPIPTHTASGNGHITKSTRDISAEQTKMFIEELPDIEERLIDAVGYVGELPLNTEYDNTRYVVRVLWALEVAFHANIGPLRASDITKIIRNYGKEPVEPTNVARFFREAKRRGEYQELWNEDKPQHYTISAQGKDALNRIMKVTYDRP